MFEIFEVMHYQRLLSLKKPGSDLEVSKVESRQHWILLKGIISAQLVPSMKEPPKPTPI